MIYVCKWKTHFSYFILFMCIHLLHLQLHRFLFIFFFFWCVVATLFFFVLSSKAIHLIYCAFIASSFFFLANTWDYWIFYVLSLLYYEGASIAIHLTLENIIFNDMTYFPFYIHPLPIFFNPLPHQQNPWPIYFFSLRFLLLKTAKKNSSSQKDIIQIPLVIHMYNQKKLSPGMKSWYFLFFNANDDEVLN